MGTHARFVADIPNDEPRYAVCDFKFTNSEGIPQERIILVYWSPDDKATRKAKMLYASTNDAFLENLQFCVETDNSSKRVRGVSFNVRSLKKLQHWMCKLVCGAQTFVKT